MVVGAEYFAEQDQVLIWKKSPNTCVAMWSAGETRVLFCQRWTLIAVLFWAPICLLPCWSLWLLILNNEGSAHFTSCSYIRPMTDSSKCYTKCSPSTLLYEPHQWLPYWLTWSKAVRTVLMWLMILLSHVADDFAHVAEGFAQGAGDFAHWHCSWRLCSWSSPSMSKSLTLWATLVCVLSDDNAGHGYSSPVCLIYMHWWAYRILQWLLLLEAYHGVVWHCVLWCCCPFAVSFALFVCYDHSSTSNGHQLCCGHASLCPVTVCSHRLPRVTGCGFTLHLASRGQCRYSFPSGSLLIFFLPSCPFPSVGYPLGKGSCSAPPLGRCLLRGCCWCWQCFCVIIVFLLGSLYHAKVQLWTLISLRANGVQIGDPKATTRTY